MPNGNELNEQLEFEERIRRWSEPEQFIARQVYKMASACPAHDRRIKALEDNTKKSAGITGGISGTITGTIVGIISYFTGR